MAEEAKYGYKKDGTPRKRPVREQEWKKGQSGNPNGRPKLENSFTDILREIAARPHTKGDPRTVAEAISEKLIAQALAGDFYSQKYILDRVDGGITKRSEVDMTLKDIKVAVELVKSADTDKPTDN